MHTNKDTQIHIGTHTYIGTYIFSGRQTERQKKHTEGHMYRKTCIQEGIQIIVAECGCGGMFGSSKK